jgi:hypothetical protein
MWLFVCQSMESDFSDIRRRNPRDLSISACGEEFVVVGDCFKVSMSWF